MPLELTVTVPAVVLNGVAEPSPVPYISPVPAVRLNVPVLSIEYEVVGLDMVPVPVAVILTLPYVFPDVSPTFPVSCTAPAVTLRVVPEAGAVGTFNVEPLMLKYELAEAANDNVLVPGVVSVNEVVYMDPVPLTVPVPLAINCTDAALVGVELPAMVEFTTIDPEVAPVSCRTTLLA